MDRWLWLIVLIGVWAGDRLLRRRFPRLWRRLQLPVNLVLTVLCLLYLSIWGVALAETWTADAGMDSKVVLTVLLLAAIAAFLYLIVDTGRRYLRERRGWREEGTP